MKPFRQSAFPQPPRAQEVAYTHPDGRPDPYAWLRDPGYPKVTDEAILDYLRAENTYVDQVLGGEGDQRPALLEEFKALVIPDDTSPPEWWFGRHYSYRYSHGQEHPVWFRTGESGDETFLDENIRAEEKDFFQLGGWTVTKDHRRLAWLEDVDGSERLRLHIRDLEGGKDLTDTAFPCSYGLVWSNDGKTIFYIQQDEAQRPRWVYRKTLGMMPELIYEESDASFFVGIGASPSGQFLIIESAAKTSSETWLLSLDTPGEKPWCVLPRRADHEYDVADRGDELLIRTNDTHRNFRLVRAPLKDPAETNWKEVIAPSDEVYLSAIGTAQDFWWVTERADGQRRVRVIPGGHESDAKAKLLTFPEAAYVVYALDGHQWDRGTLRLRYESPARPKTYYDYHVAEERLEIIQEAKVPGHNPDDYEVWRDWAVSHDGTKVPLTLVRHKSRPVVNQGPLLLYGYGSYGASMDPGFSPNRVPFLKRGMVWCIAHIRGGQEMGRAWYEDGKFLKKKNTFADFIAAAEHLIKGGVTAKGRIAAMGGSAGGMLMGAVVNERPDLFGAICALVPFVDVLSTMLDATLPLTPPEYLEWGNPADPAYYDYMKSYSPYDNVAAKDYPAMLITAGLSDPRVTYWEPAKWAAKLRAHKTGDNILLLKTEMTAGHGGASGRYAALEEVAERLAFVQRALGLE
ncbi:S9 family peptidase [Lacibacterium aquatile]|uniref:S9 family peptidase n=1 Tax=Lacibacterium aquatile TaxID=1168082 RepID=A0ABW5DT73_9PROT